MEYPKFKVCARCFTFNQSKYITDTMNGFIMQKTDFPFVCCIVDDASTDGEQEVIMSYVKENFNLSEGFASYQKETDYAHITYAQHKTNANCYFAVLLLKENHYSRHKPKMQYLSEWVNEVPYEALCEGDDYWVDQYKLQKQSEVLDAHPDCMLTFHAINEIYMKHRDMDHIRTRVENREYSGVEWYLTRPSQFASFMLRRKIYSDVFYRESVFAKFPAGDIPLLLTCARYGTIIGISDVMSVYRHNDGGWTSQKRNKKEVWKLAESHLQFEIFGPEYKKAAWFFYQRECVGYFLSSLRRGKIYPEFLWASLKVSLKGTIKSIFLTMRRKYV